MSRILDHNTISDLPIVALILFMAVFLLVAIKVFRTRRDDPKMAYLANLPLADDVAAPDTTPTPSPEDDRA